MANFDWLELWLTKYDKYDIVLYCDKLANLHFNRRKKRMKQWSKDELQELALSALRHVELVEIAAHHSPNRARDIAALNWPQRQVRATRFLAMLRRDYGAEAFHAFVKSMEHTRPTGTEHAQGGHKMIAASLSKEPQFLYPSSRQYPMDEICEQIVRELEARNWNVPGITVKFDVYGTGAQKLRLVREIKGHNFRIRYGRSQGQIKGGRWNDTAAVRTIIIPKQSLSVYEDESGPSYVLYVGEDWERDSDWFMHASFVNSKLCNEPRRYLRYTGECHCSRCDMRHTHPRSRPPLLVHTNDLNREYEPRELEKGQERSLSWDFVPENYEERQNLDAPSCLETNKVMHYFTMWLHDNVMPLIVICPKSIEKIDIFVGPQPTLFPENIGPIFTFAEWRDAERIKIGKQGPAAWIGNLHASDVYGMLGSGYRLVSLGVSNDGSFPKVAYDGFLWCGLGEVTQETNIEILDVPGHYRWSDREQFVVRITPNAAEGIYVADWDAFDQSRNATFNSNPEGYRASDGEVGEWYRAAARTMIPITEYKGDFKKPVVLINRELDFDEVEVVSGPHNDRMR